MVAAGCGPLLLALSKVFRVRTGEEDSGNREGQDSPSPLPTASPTRAAGSAGPPCAVDQVLEIFAGLEVRNALLRNLDVIAGLGVAALTRAPTSHAEAAEAAQLDLVVALQRIDDRREDGVDDRLGVLLADLSGS